MLHLHTAWQTRGSELDGWVGLALVFRANQACPGHLIAAATEGGKLRSGLRLQPPRGSSFDQDQQGMGQADIPQIPPLPCFSQTRPFLLPAAASRCALLLIPPGCGLLAAPHKPSPHPSLLLPHLPVGAAAVAPSSEDAAAPRAAPRLPWCLRGCLQTSSPRPPDLPGCLLS